MSYIWKRT